ncbi:hypothetical protein [Paenarthrobacter aurescens]|uniref:hypothetical protein n=1 Tax=Paenarthrobacter aurescens TaxID=43663 RepID=UPI0021BF29E6|nr:hypothetical protein [Paenarthrobacter aurescens]MCT9869343.1 hypothetical protein [Paenarthrobacter aurescens]
MSTNEPGKAREAQPTEALPKETRPTEALPKPNLQQIPLTPNLEPSFKVEHPADEEPQQARIGTVVWGLIVIALAALIVISTLGWVTLNGTYVLIGLMIGAGAALVVGGLLSARKGSKKVTTTK